MEIFVRELLVVLVGRLSQSVPCYLSFPCLIAPPTARKTRHKTGNDTISLRWLRWIS